MGACIDERPRAVDLPLGVTHAGALSLLDGCFSTRAPRDGDLLSREASSMDDTESSVC